MVLRLILFVAVFIALAPSAMASVLLEPHVGYSYTFVSQSTTSIYPSYKSSTHIGNQTGMAWGMRFGYIDAEQFFYAVELNAVMGTYHSHDPAVLGQTPGNRTPLKDITSSVPGIYFIFGKQIQSAPLRPWIGLSPFVGMALDFDDRNDETTVVRGYGAAFGIGYTGLTTPSLPLAINGECFYHRYVTYKEKTLEGERRTQRLHRKIDNIGFKLFASFPINFRK